MHVRFMRAISVIAILLCKRSSSFLNRTVNRTCKRTLEDDADYNQSSKVAFTRVRFTQYASLIKYILNIFCFLKCNNLLCKMDLCERSLTKVKPTGWPNFCLHPVDENFHPVHWWITAELIGPREVALALVNCIFQLLELLDDN